MSNIGHSILYSFMRVSETTSVGGRENAGFAGVTVVP